MPKTLPRRKIPRYVRRYSRVMSSTVEPADESDAGRSRFRRALRRIGASADQLEAQELQEEAVEAGGTPILRCTVGQQVCVSGTLRSVTLRPQGGVPSL